MLIWTNFRRPESSFLWNRSWEDKFLALLGFVAAGVAFPEMVQLLVDQSWLEILQGELQKQYIDKLAQFVRQEVAGKYPIYPPAAKVFNAFNTCPLNNVKVVILGQVRMSICPCNVWEGFMYLCISILFVVPINFNCVLSVCSSKWHWGLLWQKNTWLVILRPFVINSSPMLCFWFSHFTCF